MSDRLNEFHSQAFQLLESVSWVIDQHPLRDTDVGLDLIRQLVQSFSASHLHQEVSG